MAELVAATRPPDRIRVLITGSRDWADREAIMRALTAVHRRLDVPAGRTVVVHGGARGADTLAHSVAVELGMRTEVHLADWDRHGKAAGVLRNQEMVDLGAVGCVAFPRGVSRGTRHCMAACVKAGIPVWNRGDL